jgi:hypothetical protein
VDQPGAGLRETDHSANIGATMPADDIPQLGTASFDQFRPFARFAAVVNTAARACRGPLYRVAPCNSFRVGRVPMAEQCVA